MQFEQSARLLERARRVLPGGVNSNVRSHWDPHPMFYSRGEGPRCWDADGNEYIDYVLGRGPLILGHTPKPVLDAVAKQLYEGLMYAGQHEIEVEAAEMVCKLTPCADRVRFGSSGSEAVHAALRLARAATGRKLILRFEAGYHGWFDNISWSNGVQLDKVGSRERPNLIPSSEGQLVEDAKHLVVTLWNDLDLMENIFKEKGDQIAGIITEPMLANNGAIEPLPGYLAGLREICDRYGTVLIFDEVITGFRLGPASGMGHYGVTPDIATFAKAIGGGMPVGAIAGRADLMDRFATLKINQAGTYNAMPFVMAAVKKTLELLSENDGARLKHASDIAERLRQGFRALGRKLELPLDIRGAGPIIHASFMTPGFIPVIDSRTYAQTDVAQTRRLFRELQLRGIRSTPTGLMFVSTEHGEREVGETLAATEQALIAMLSPEKTMRKA